MSTLLRFEQPIAEMIWDMKYRYRLEGKVFDQSLADTFSRVAKAIAGVEKPAVKQRVQQAFYQILSQGLFLPGGRILAGAGTAHHVTLFNCFVMPIQEDSISGIFNALREGALTLQQGGGVGYDFSLLRPAGDPVASGGVASGPVAFMKVWDTMSSVLVSTGARTGAMMGVLRCDHPDIEAFVTAKHDPNLLRHFNVSVLVTDEFMTAVQADQDWPLIFPTRAPDSQSVQRHWVDGELRYCKVYRNVRARELWDKIIRSAYDAAEPGVLFGDTINRLNTLSYCEHIDATNPCGEIPLPAYGACDLGAINLPRLVRKAFTSDAHFAWETFDETIKIATRFLDNVIDVSRYPLLSQQQKAYSTRRIGLGVTGLADALVMLNVRYDSKEALAFTQQLMQRLATQTWLASAYLAKEKGCFPLYTPDYLQGAFFKTLPAALRKTVMSAGMRNSHHNTIAPAGTISLLANNVSNGIEPIFRAHYERKIRLETGEIVTHEVVDYAHLLWRKTNKGMPPAWVDIDELTPDAHLAIQGAAQQYIDNAISKTINLPANFPFEQLADVYSKAYALGLKGCTVFRPNPITGSILLAPAEPCCQIENDIK